MKFCSNCGKEILDEAVICVHCKTPVEDAGALIEANAQAESQSREPEKKAPPEDKRSIGLMILSIFFPFVGIILFFTSRKETPKKAKSILIGTIIGAVLYVVAILLNFLISAIITIFSAIATAIGAIFTTVIPAIFTALAGAISLGISDAISSVVESIVNSIVEAIKESVSESVSSAAFISSLRLF